MNRGVERRNPSTADAIVCHARPGTNSAHKKPWSCLNKDVIAGDIEHEAKDYVSSAAESRATGGMSRNDKHLQMSFAPPPAGEGEVTCCKVVRKRARWLDGRGCPAIDCVPVHAA